MLVWHTVAQRGTRHLTEAQRAERAQAEDPDHFADVRAKVKLAARGAVRTAIDDDLIGAVIEALGEGVWPRELPEQVGVPRALWRSWLRQGDKDLAQGLGGDMARLAGVVTRGQQRLEAGYRDTLERLASSKGQWTAAAWLLRHLAPGRYSESIEAAVDTEVARLLAVARDALGPEAYETLVQALEAARAGTSG